MLSGLLVPLPVEPVEPVLEPDGVPDVSPEPVVVVLVSLVDDEPGLEVLVVRCIEERLLRPCPAAALFFFLWCFFVFFVFVVVVVPASVEPAPAVVEVSLLPLACAAAGHATIDAPVSA